jgi:hypothetical protein
LLVRWPVKASRDRGNGGKVLPASSKRHAERTGAGAPLGTRKALLKSFLDNSRRAVDLA